MYATLRDLGAQGPLWEAAQSRGCPPGSLETLQLDVRDVDSVAAARARVTEGRVDVLGESPRNMCAGAFPALCPNQNVLEPRDHKGTGWVGGRRGRWRSASLPAVCNAGRGLLGPLEAHEAGAVGSVLDVNVAGTVRTLQAFLPDMKRRRSGRILVTGSFGGLMGAWNGAELTGGAGPGAMPRATVGSGQMPSQMRLQKPHLSWKGCHSTPFTAPASSQSKVYARVWRFCCRPSGSSESPPRPQHPLNPDFGNPSTLTCLSHSQAFSLAPFHCGSQSLYARCSTGHLALVSSLMPPSWEAEAQRGYVNLPKVTQLRGACQDRKDSEARLSHTPKWLCVWRGRGAFPAVSRFSKSLVTSGPRPTRRPRLAPCPPGPSGLPRPRPPAALCPQREPHRVRPGAHRLPG